MSATQSAAAVRYENYCATRNSAPGYHLRWLKTQDLWPQSLSAFAKSRCDHRIIYFVPCTQYFAHSVSAHISIFYCQYCQRDRFFIAALGKSASSWISVLTVLTVSPLPNLSQALHVCVCFQVSCAAVGSTSTPPPPCAASAMTDIPQSTLLATPRSCCGVAVQRSYVRRRNVATVLATTPGVTSVLTGRQQAWGQRWVCSRHCLYDAMWNPLLSGYQFATVCTLIIDTSFLKKHQCHSLYKIKTICNSTGLFACYLVAYFCPGNSSHLLLPVLTISAFWMMGLC